ncbi:sugar phosphate nucleotidyltransferase [Natrinema sp. CBA1119]|uniref:sugar phosphate nucleotidyltransferase n=1 Tax=Natrinema sp. CBA1119 TaxID=1608465 RepID=UPI0020D26564|nr:sugar phosphate nucleotidyltransferase [Natrinema sp. CBA1119]
MPINYVHQRDRLGLDPAVLQAEPHVDGSFVVVNGDNIFGTSLRPVVEAADREDTDGALAVTTVSREAATKTGVIETVDGSVTDIVEKPTDPPSTLVKTGCYVLPEDVFEACKLVQLSAEGEYQLSEAVGLLVSAGYAIETVQIDERVNFNQPDDIDRARELVASGDEQVYELTTRGSYQSRLSSYHSMNSRTSSRISREGS